MTVPTMLDGAAVSDNALLLETGGEILLEDGSGAILLEVA